MSNREYEIPLLHCDLCDASVEVEKAPEQDWLRSYIPIGEDYETDGYVCPECQSEHFRSNEDGIPTQVSE